MQIMLPATPSGQKQRYSHLLRIAAKSSQCSGRIALSSGIVQPSSPAALFGLIANAIVWSFLPVRACRALISLIGIGPNPSSASSQGSFHISFHPSAKILAIFDGAHCHVPS
eukprot:15794475-Heterocapsa_arctica.AAC.1